jgi:hypothetical protein
MSSDLNEVFAGLQADGAALAQGAFTGALGNCQSLAKQMVPVGVYNTGRGAKAIQGGALQSSLHVEFLGRADNTLIGRCTSNLPYARVQHDEPFHHPGLYTGGRAGEVYASRYFERAMAMIFYGTPDPLGRYQGPVPATFEQLLKEAQAQ